MANKTSKNRYLTPEFRQLYNALIKPKEKEGKDGKYYVYELTMGFAKPAKDKLAAGQVIKGEAPVPTTLVDAVLEWVKEALPKEHDAWVKAFKNWPNVPSAIAGYKQPFLDGDEKRNPAYHGQIAIRVKTEYTPAVVDRNKKPITNPDAIYAGSYGRAVLIPRYYDSFKGGLPGIGFYLGNYQFTRNGDRIVTPPSADDDFSALPETTDDLDGLE